MEFIDFGWDRQMGDVPLGFAPSDLPSLELWTRYNQGITVTGSGVSQWDDQSGNGNHLKQGTDLDRPQKQANGSILFDGIRQFLKADAFTLVQPETVYILLKQITWTASDRVFDGNALNSGALAQSGTTPNLNMYAGTSMANNGLSVGVYGVISIVINSTSSAFQVDNDPPVTGDLGINNLGGLTLGASGDNVSWANIQVKECLIYSAPHDAATRAAIIAYLQSI